MTSVGEPRDLSGALPHAQGKRILVIQGDTQFPLQTLKKQLCEFIEQLGL
jgi:hypothetical protein